MKPILFEKDATDFTGLGICHLQDAISCIVTEERNGAFELELVYPVSGANFSEITEDRIIAVKARENGTRQGFRIYRITATLTGEVTVNARHISYQLNFVPVGVTSGTGTAQNMMAALKSAALEPCPFTFESDISTSHSYAFDTPVALRTALGGTDGSVLDLFGGEYEWDNWTVKLHASRGSDKGARIAYGKNMTALQRSVDIGELITGVSAFWAGQNDSGADVIVYSNPRVITNGNQDLYSHHRTIVLDVSAEFETVPTQAQVTAYATTYLAATTLAQVSEAVTVDFVPLWQTQEYAGSFEEHIDLCDIVTVVYKELGVSVKKKVTKTVYDVILNRYESIELGGEVNIADTITSLSSSSSDIASEVARLGAQVIPLERGGTGATTASDARTNLGLGSLATVSNLTTKIKTKTVTVNHGNIAANNNTQKTTTVAADSGYAIMGVIGWEITGTGWGYCYVTRAVANHGTGNQSLYTTVVNRNSSQATGINLKIILLEVATS